MKKRLIPLLAAVLCLALALCACGKKNEAAAPADGSEIQSGSAGALDPEGQSSGGEETAEPKKPSFEDDEYLILLNKTHPVGDDYYPDDMVEVERIVSGVGTKETHQLRQAAADALNAMFDAAAEDGLELRMRTGFRSYDYQKKLFSDYASRNGEEKANTFSARPGQSEHQSGLACDLAGKSSGFALTYDFGDTKEGQWVAEHAHEYGFIIRYIDGTRSSAGPITGYVFEPWHVRYVGVEHASAIHEQGVTLEEYLGMLD
jgi:D-alanyl-D-alanine carboxypeptidase